MVSSLFSVVFQTVKINSDNLKIRHSIENMLNENAKMVVSMYGSFPFIYFIGINDSRITLLLLIQLVCSMGYALIYHKESDKIYVAVSEHSFLSGFGRIPQKIYNFKKMDIPRFGYRTFMSIAKYQKYVNLRRISFCYLNTEISMLQMEQCEKILKEYRWDARRFALLVASRIMHGNYFHVFKIIAKFI